MIANYRIETLPNNFIQITGECEGTKQLYSVTVRASDWQRYINGAVVQKAFPYLTSEKREFLVSGYSPAGWQQLFPRNGANR